MMPPRRTSSSPVKAARLLLPVVVLVLIAGGIGGTLWATGFFEPETTPVSRAGHLAFPALARPVRAYDAITRDDLINPQTRQLNVTWIPEAHTSPAMLRDLSQIIGRVVTRDKQAGYVLTERDMFPAGTRPGIAAGIPPGKRSVTVNIADVPGLELLHQGDVFDLMAVLPQKEQLESNIEQAALLGGIKPPDTRSGQLARQTGIKPLVLGGTMVAITQGKDRSTDGAQGLVVPPAGSRTARTPQMVATIAVDPVEVAPLTEALGLDLNLYCVARSGHPEDKPVVAETVLLEGLVPVVTLAQPVKAFAEITQDDLADHVTGRLNLYYFPPERVQEGWLTGFTELNGRVPSHDLSRGAVITEADLMPAGTPPGVASAAPVGTSVLSVRADRLPGLTEFRAGSLLTVYQVLREEHRPAFPITDWAALQGAILNPEDARLQADLRQGLTLVADEVVLLKPAVGEGAAVVVAVPTASVVRLSQAISSETSLVIAAHSGPATLPQINADTMPATVDLIPARLPSNGVIRPALRRGGDVPTLFVDGSDQGVPAGYVAVPVTARSIQAWSRIQVSDFVDPATGRPRIMLFPEGRVAPDWISDLDTLIDRVVVRDVDSGRSLRMSDLAPAGSQPGPSTGIPSGMVGVYLTGDQVGGLDEAIRLNSGDRFQFLLGQQYDLGGLAATSKIALSGGDAIEQSHIASSLQLADVSLLVDEALLIEIGEPTRVTRTNVVSRTETTAQTLLTPEGPVRTETTRSEPEVVESLLETRSYLFAIRPSDATALTEALSAKAQVVAIPIRGVPNIRRTETSGTRPGVVESGEPQSTEETSPGAAISSETEADADAFRATGVTEAPASVSSQSSGPRVIEHIRGSTVSREIWTSARSRPATVNESPSSQPIP